MRGRSNPGSICVSGVAAGGYGSSAPGYPEAGLGADSGPRIALVLVQSFSFRAIEQTTAACFWGRVFAGIHGNKERVTADESRSKKFGDAAGGSRPSGEG